MTEPDPHAPTAAGPEPTPVVPPSEASYQHPVGTPWPGDTEEKPEILVGAAFAGGVVAAMILKRITGGGR
jgi:hypothetical protein